MTAQHLHVILEWWKKITNYSKFIKLIVCAPYKSYTGGVTTVSSKQYSDVNGFSNFYWGWGLEDDDFFKRLEAHQYYMKRPFICLSAFHSLQEDHGSQYTWSLNRFIIYWLRDIRKHYDGINSIHYDLIKVEALPFYTQIHVSLNKKKMNQFYSKIIMIPIIFLYLSFILLVRHFLVKIIRKL
ncbi:hypothetical protein HZS_4872 [Henneguya salminicola]|nr:hypothetical protein HZS_4872 [Henneguya salminicola]